MDKAITMEIEVPRFKLASALTIGVTRGARGPWLRRIFIIYSHLVL